MLILQQRVGKHLKAMSTLTPSLLMTLLIHFLGKFTTTIQSATNRRIAISTFPFGFSAFSLNIDCLLLLFRKHAQIEFLPSQYRIPCKQALIRFTPCTLLSRSREPLDLDTVTVSYDTSSTVYFRSAPLSLPGLRFVQTFSGLSVINLNAKSTQLLKSEHHKAVWSQCLNTLTDRPTQSILKCLCCVRLTAT
jgi:hypothetical protein